MVRETVTLEGHIIDSDVRRVMGKIVEHDGGFEIEEFRVGRCCRRACARCASTCLEREFAGGT
jgi:hypothetical protein